MSSTVEQKDLIVLGSGPGGYIAAIRASQLGRKVTIIERESLGGVCLNWGCIPSKALLKSASIYQDIKHAQEFGFSVSGATIDFPKVIDRSRSVASKLSGGVSYLMKKNKIDVVFGEGKLQKGNNLLVKDKDGSSKTFNFKDIILAVGARARVLPGIEIDGELIHTYRTILEYKTLPKKTLVIGGGVIGCEFAYFHASLGADVTIVEPLPHILPLEDEEVAKGLTKSFEKLGIKIQTGALVEKVVKTKSKGVQATIKVNDQTQTWEGDCCLVSVGVQPNTEHLNLEEIGLKTDRGFIQVDDYMQTNIPNHYAIGDCTGKMMLAHVASHQGIVVAEYLCGYSEHAMKYDNVPSCVYCKPQVASIGLTEKKAKEQGLPYRATKVPFSAIGKAIAIGESDGFIKVLTDKNTEEVLGVHILHAEATELIAEAGLLRQLEGVASTAVETIHPHPTLSEAMLEVMAAAVERPLST
jgi:dihydrolipoamide dehydrogenase